MPARPAASCTALAASVAACAARRLHAVRRSSLSIAIVARHQSTSSQICSESNDAATRCRSSRAHRPQRGVEAVRRRRARAVHQGIVRRPRTKVVDFEAIRPTLRGEPVEDVVLGDEQARRARGRAAADTSTTAPPTMVSTRPASSPGLCRRCADGSRARVRNTSSAAPRVGAEAVDRVPRVGDALLDRGNGGDRAREPDGGLHVVEPGQRDVRPRSTSSRTTRHGLGQLLGGRRVGVQVRLGDPHAADVDRDRRARASLAPTRELGRAAPDVDDEERATARPVRPAVAPWNERRASSSPESSSGVGARAPRVAAAKNSSRFVASRASARRRRPGARSAGARDGVRVLPEHGERCGRSRRGRGGASRRRPRPRRVMCIRRSSGRERCRRARRGGTSATRSRTELVPMSTAATRVTRAGPRPRRRPGRRRRRGARRSARAGTSRRRGCPRPRRAGGARPIRPGTAASRSAAYTACARGEPGPGRQPPPAARTPPAASRRATRRVRVAVDTASSGSASGVPSRVNGRVADHDRARPTRRGRRPRSRRSGSRPSRARTASTSVTAAIGRSLRTAPVLAAAGRRRVGGGGARRGGDEHVGRLAGADQPVLLVGRCCSTAALALELLRLVLELARSPAAAARGGRWAALIWPRWTR